MVKYVLLNFVNSDTNLIKILQITFLEFIYIIILLFNIVIYYDILFIYIYKTINS